MNKNVFQHVIAGEIISKEDSYTLLHEILTGLYNEFQIAAVLGALSTRDISIEELTGFREALLAEASPINLSQFDTVDICGTGGDGKNTFNISTLAAFIVAGAGFSVAKHGNYASSSLVGSSNVLEALKIPFAKTEAHAVKLIEETNICFLHAPYFHPALKPLAALRKSLGFRTIFNVLGPLCNPSKPKRMVLGVSNKHLHRTYAGILQQMDCHFAVVSSLDGYDEISLTNPTSVTTNFYQRNVSSKDFGFDFAPLSPRDLNGTDTAKDAATLLITILEGKGTAAQNAVAIANASMAIERFSDKKHEDLTQSVAKATESLQSGAALKVLKKLTEMTL